MTTNQRRRRGHRQHNDGIIFGAWNTHNASKARLKRYIRSELRRGAVAIVLTEVWSRHSELRRIARQFGLTMLAETPEPGARQRKPVSERGDTVMLLAPCFDLESWKVIELEEDWYVDSAGRWHEPRRLILARGYVHGQRLEVLGVHGPTNNRFNRAAVAEFERVVARIVSNTRKDTISAAVGDFNIRLTSAKTWARENGLHTSGQGPDLILANRETTSETGPRRGSDHHTVTHRTAA